ncbi:helix-turn-helix transcriptional regulator [Candidatus Saccharibacteria bacterium]|nr:helix-turn-helix transcriptional regulator [Candidatus Saccharibacteria bacterium]
MDLQKIGKFIAKKRQENKFTQEGLAEKLDISDRSVSKWERGICLPDANNMAKLCEIFDISYNELLSGEELEKPDYEKRAEENLKEFAEIETAQNKRFLLYEAVFGTLLVLMFVVLMFVVSFPEMEESFRTISIIFGLTLVVIGSSFCIKIETEVGKYKCKNCDHLYIPKYSSTFFAPHIGRTRYMICPKCHKKSWQKKIT